MKLSLSSNAWSPSLEAARWKISHGLFNMVVAVLASMALVAIGLITWNLSYQRRFAEAEMERTVHAFSVALDRQLLVTIATLESLAIGMADDPNSERAYRVAQEVKARHPQWSHVTLREAGGDLLFSTALPFGTPAPSPNPVDPLVAKTLATGQPQVSDLMYGPIAQAYVAAVLVPVPGKDGPSHVLIAVVTATKWEKLLQEEGVAAGWVAGIIDAAGVVVARTRAAERFVGKPAPRWVLDAIRQAPEGRAEGPALEGEPLSLVYSRSAVSGWTVAFAAPAAVFEEPLWRSLWLSIVVSGLMMVVAALFVLGYARRLSLSVTGLARVAEAMERPGADLPSVPASASAELALVYGSLHTASRHLRKTVEEHTTAMRELQHRVKNDLQAIMSLIALERFQTGCAGSCGILSELEGRIEVLRLVHSRLYDASQVGTVELGGYLQELCGHAIALYRRGRVEGITFEAKVDEVRVDHGTAVSLGLIANEFITNSAKHAFPGRAGTITLELWMGETSRAWLRLADDGVGMAANRTRSSGTKLIEMLADQVGAEPEWSVDAGTSLLLSFAVETPAEVKQAAVQG
ncbi:sensor histidine kinase [Azospirillum doebereinerae]|uniref:histidine kinase n=2 Tax=Azospirillum doebereinerae TaxID=92933 RepID=A0A433JAF9_9PROT|nr:sensor histidine kinase [Azospirillum doebereinerae]MCG5243882.1 sensor histidine kinase [Azospirillum doebereinerae]RUQ72797.1 sensor histidine kinase [Azospirillum doebereinerae]